MLLSSDCSVVVAKIFDTYLANIYEVLVVIVDLILAEFFAGEDFLLSELVQNFF